MGISAEEYFNKVGAKKDVELPSGVTFTIRKVQGRELLGEPMPFSSKTDLKGVDDEKLEEQWQNMDPQKQKQTIEFNNTLIHKALVEPKLTKEQIDDIPPEDYNFLATEVTSFSFGKIQDVDPTKGTTTS